MAEKVDLSFAGLATSVNPFSAAPELSAAILDNCVIRNKNLIEPRRGYNKIATTNPSGNNSRVFPWQSRLMVVATNGALRDYTTAGGWSGTYIQPASGNWSSTTTFSAPDASNPIRAAFAGKSMFFTSSVGVKAIDALSASVRDAGIPAPATVYCTGKTTGSHPLWLLNGNTVAYRVVLGKRDANNKLILSAPSQPVVRVGTAVNGEWVRVYFTLPVNANGATFVQLYRTVQTAASSPGDEMYLVQEMLLTSVTAATDIFATAAQYGFYYFEDYLDDSAGTGSILIGDPLYTNPLNGDGIGAANSLPPLARDVCVFNDRLLYVNTTDRHSIELQMIGLQGLVADTSTIVVGGVTFKMTSGGDFDPTASPPTFQIYTGAATPAIGIDDSARTFVACVNMYNYKHGGGIQAVYLSTPDTAPGQMVFRETGIGGSSFTIAVGQNSQLAWSPDLSKTSITLTSDNDRQPAKLWWATDGEPWAVPTDNWAIPGSAEHDILRAVVVRNTAFIFKKDGLYTATGVAPYTIQPFDPGLVLLAPESCAVCNNQIFCLTNRGYVSVNEAGVSPSLSRPIERDLASLQAGSYSTYTTRSYGFSYENEGLVFLAMPAGSGDAYPSYQYVFNANNPSWSRFRIANTVHGCFDPSLNAIAWAIHDGSVWEEQKNITASDIFDIKDSCTTNATLNSATVIVSGSATAPLVGDVVYQGSNYARIIAVSGTTCTLDGLYSFSAAAASLYHAFTCQIRFLPWAAGDPAMAKAIESLYLGMKNTNVYRLAVGFNSEVNTTFSSRTISIPSGIPNTGTVMDQMILRCDVPQTQSMPNTLGMDITITQAFAFWQLEAVRITYEPSTATSRR